MTFPVDPRTLCGSGERPRCEEKRVPGRRVCYRHAEQLDRVREQLEVEPDFNPTISEDFDA